VALYCEVHRAEVRAEAQRKHLAKVGDKHRRAYVARHHDKVLASARKYAHEHREEMAEYKRQWRKRNRDKVRAQKRRAALRRGGRTPDGIRRWREEVLAGSREPTRAPRNADGQRLCLHGCRRVLTGRAKICESCKRGLALEGVAA
jgi:hypothetical protein